MKRLFNTLVLAGLLALIAAAPLQAQSAYYWSDGKKLDLYEDKTSVFVHFDGPVVEKVLMSTLKAKADVKSVNYFPHRNRAVIHFNQPQTGRAEELPARLGLDAFTVRSAHYGFALDDGFQMWPTHQVVLRMKPGLDWFLLIPYFGESKGRFYDENFGNIRMEVDDINQVVAIANKIHASGLVEFCHPDFYAPVTLFQDPLYPQQFQMHNTGQTIDGYAGLNDVDIDAPEAWAITTGSPSVIVGVIDDGVENHEDMNDGSGNTRVIGGNTPLNGGNGAPNSSGAHGQACAGIIGATHNTLGVRGAAPQSRFLTVNIFAGSETPTDIANGINWAVSNGSWVLSNSWGYTSCTASYSVLTNAINSAASSGRGGLGCVVVFASGNGSKNCVDYPANLASVIAVGAVTNQGVRSSYSNYGSALDIVAPSNGAAGVRTIDRMGSPGYSTGNYTNTFGGTSAACPAVSGVAALVLAANGSLTGAQVKQILEDTADDMGPAGDDLEYANGRVNAHQAILCATGGGCVPPPPPPAYCTSQGSNASYEWIAQVVFGSFSNSSGGGSGYTDFTNLTINANQGSTYNVTLTPGFSGSTYTEYYRIWVDFNQDLDFDDAGELIFSGGPSTGAVSGTATISAGALTGNTRMRVSMKYNAAQTGPCETFSYGEVEDYTINISGGAATCDTPGSLSSSGVTSSGATLSWGAVSGASSYDLRYRPVGGSYTQVNAIGGTSYGVSGLAASTTYEWSVRTNCSNGLTSAWSSNATFTTSAPPPTSYCNAGGTNANDEWIDLVQLGAINNVTGSNGGYANFTNLSTTVVRGTNNTISFSKGSPFSDWGYWRVYVDWNQDGDFTDSGEQEVSGRSRSNGTVTGTISVPNNAVLGTTRMRVMMKYGSYPTSCEVYTWGETEDYTLNVASSLNNNGPAPAFASNDVLSDEEAVAVSPNPAFSSAYVQIDVHSAIEQAYIADMNGRMIQPIAPQPGRQEIQVAHLPEGMYLIVVQTETGVVTTRMVKVN